MYKTTHMQNKFWNLLKANKIKTHGALERFCYNIVSKYYDLTLREPNFPSLGSSWNRVNENNETYLLERIENITQPDIIGFVDLDSRQMVHTYEVKHVNGDHKSKNSTKYLINQKKK